MSLDERLRHELRRASRLAVVDPEGDRRAGQARAERGRRRQRMLLAAAVVVLVAGAAVMAIQLTDDGSGGDTVAGPGPGPVQPRPTAPLPEGDAPPNVVVTSATRTVELRPFTYCWTTKCVDGIPPDSPEDLGADDELEVAFALPDWELTATLTAVGQERPRYFEVPLEPTGDGAFRLPPAGPAGAYDVSLFGQGDGGDVVYAFRWTTTVDGPLPEPTARLAVLASTDGRVDSYGVELEVRQLAETPAQATATITVRAPDGEEVSFAAPGNPDQLSTEGTVYWSGGMEDGQAAAALADEGPFTYEVTLVLDGVTHRATATWPDDVIVGNEPSVALHFDPALPAMAYE